MKAAIVLAGAMALAACATNRETVPQTYDFGLAGAPTPPTLSLEVLDMRSPEWLDGTHMLYRLAYRDARAITPYGASRWAGSPASMLTVRLRQQLGNLPGARCTLATRLAEFSQTFDAPQASRAMLNVHAILAVSGTPAQRLQREFRLERATPTPDAAGGAAALSQLAEELAKSVQAWAGESGLCGPG
ncbi:MAG TPA: ABC-type transport auxiliary lipoprotein family protein [Burkholderiales bacterium]|nr:ABC-type transport auxiliary lipoprotein family protein [Burkholderiales bacterium]